MSPITIDGLKDLSDLLATMPQQAAKRYLSRAGEKAAGVVSDALKQSAPVEIGILEESIVSKKKFSDGDGETTMEIDIGPSKQAYYGMFQEFGTSEVEGTDKNGKHFRHAAQPAQHWMGRAFESIKEKVLSVFATEALSILSDLENKI